MLFLVFSPKVNTEVFYIIDEHVKDARAPIFDRWTRNRALAFFDFSLLVGIHCAEKLLLKVPKNSRLLRSPNCFYLIIEKCSS